MLSRCNVPGCQATLVPHCWNCNRPLCPRHGGRFARRRFCWDCYDVLCMALNFEGQWALLEREGKVDATGSAEWRRTFALWATILNPPPVEELVRQENVRIGRAIARAARRHRNRG